MNKVLKLWNRISRRTRLVIDCTAIALLLLVILLYLAPKSCSAEAAFRRALEDAACEAAELEICVESDTEYNSKRTYGFGANESYACRATVYENHGWSASNVYSVPAMEQGLFCVPIDWQDLRWYLGDSSRLYNDWTGEEMLFPCFAVKCPGVAASLTVVLEEGEIYNYSDEEDDRVLSQGGRFPLVLQKAENGWFVFRFDTKALGEQTHGDSSGSRYDEPYQSYVRWIQRSCGGWGPEYLPKAGLELTAWDENGSVVRHTSWELP